MISLSVLLLTMSASMSGIYTSYKIFHNQRAMTQAIGVAEMVTESLLMMDSGDDALSLGEHSRYFDKQGRELSSDSDTYYYSSWVVSPYESVAGIRQIDVTVTWTEKRRAHQITWLTYRN